MITLISSPNGFGHFFRLLDIAKYLSKKNKIIFLCSKKQINKIDNIKKLKNIKFHSIIKEADLKKNTFKYLYKFYNLNFLKLPDVNKSNLIISDNLINQIYREKKFFLISNFLWSKVKKENNIYFKKYLAAEIDFLKNNKIIQNKYFKMKISAKKIIEINFTGKKKILLSPKYKYENKKIFFYRNPEDQYSRKLLNKFLDKYTIYSNCKFLVKEFPKIKFLKINLEKISQFTFILSKPGLGSIKDSLKIGVPLLLTNVNYNREYLHNSRVIKKNNLGIVCDEKKIDQQIKNLSFKKYKNLINSQNKIKFSGEKKIPILIKL